MKKYLLDDYYLEPKGKISKRVMIKSDNVTAFILNIAEGALLPEHTHLQSTLILQVMAGQAKVTVDGREDSLQPGALLRIEGKERMKVLNSGKGTLRLYVTISPMGSEDFAGDADI